MTTFYPANKIIYFISPPRSLSVAFLRHIQARGDFSIMHEPSQLIFNRAHSPELVQSWFRPDAFQSFAEVKKAIISASEHSHVFVKEMSFAVQDLHRNDFELMKNPNVYFVFLMRNPHHTTISMYKKIAHVFDSIGYQFTDVIGYKALHEIFITAEQHAFHKPYLILTEDLYTNPQETIQKFCDHVGIVYKPEALQWDDLGDQFDGQKLWHEEKYKELTHHWHSDAIRSTGFGKPGSYAVDQFGLPTFAEITNAGHQAMCRGFYDEHLPFYNFLLEQVKKV